MDFQVYPAANSKILVDLYMRIIHGIYFICLASTLLFTPFDCQKGISRLGVFQDCPSHQVMIIIGIQLENMA